MATTVRVPVNRNVPWFRFRVALSKTTYTLEMRYNTRMQRWILSISDATGKPLLMGIPLLIMRGLLGQYRTIKLPVGPLFCIDDSGQGVEATLSSFLTDHGLVYVDTTA
jgi:hypothetical protein